MYGSQVIEYIIQLPHQRYLARLKNKNLSVINRVHTNFLFTLSLDEIRSRIIEDIKSSFSVSSLRADNTLISKVLKHGSTKGEFYYILTTEIGCRLVEMNTRMSYESVYPVSKALLKRILKLNKEMTTFPKLLSIYEETALETIDHRIYI